MIGERLVQWIISDIHLGNRRTTTDFILRNLREYFPLDKRLLDVDIIQIVGDLFDEGLMLGSTDVDLIEEWIIELLMACKTYDVQLRILEGTPSHDRGQSTRFEFHNNTYGIGCDLRYFSEPTIDYNERYDITSLYIPDEYHASAAETYEHVQRLMEGAGIQKIDFGFFHGFFEHQVPAHVDHHKSEWYRPIITRAIFCGHDHYPSVHRNFVYIQGSFDRLRFNEEGEKGYYEAIFGKDPSDFRIRFVINEGAKVYTTVDCREKSPQDALEDVRGRIGNLLDGSYVRIIVDDPVAYGSMEKTLKESYPQFNWKREIKREKVDEVTVDKPTFTLQPMNENTLPTLIEERLAYQGEDESTIKAVVERLAAYQ